MNKWLLLFIVFVGASLLESPVLRAQAMDPAKEDELHQRFMHGVELQNEGKLNDALAVFLGIIKDAPQAKGSLFYAGYTNVLLGKFEDAIPYLEQFHSLAPDDFKGLTLLIQCNQALRKTVKVEEYRKALYDLRSSTTPIPGLTDAKSYDRERVPSDQGSTVYMFEFFDYTQAPNLVFMAEQRSIEGDVMRRLNVFYNLDETKNAQAKDPKAQIFDFGEEVLKDGKLIQINVYNQVAEKPSYDVARKWMLDAIKDPPKPIASVPIQ